MDSRLSRGGKLREADWPVATTVYSYHSNPLTGFGRSYKTLHPGSKTLQLLGLVLLASCTCSRFKKLQWAGAPSAHPCSTGTSVRCAVPAAGEVDAATCRNLYS